MFKATKWWFTFLQAWASLIQDASTTKSPCSTSLQSTFTIDLHQDFEHPRITGTDYPKEYQSLEVDPEARSLEYRRAATGMNKLIIFCLRNSFNNH
jgi:hypothetical protein